MKISLYTNKQYELTPERLNFRLNRLSDQVNYMANYASPSEYKFSNTAIENCKQEINRLTNFARQMGWKV